MNKIKANSYTKLLVFFVAAIILIFAVGLVADGWQQSEPSNDYNDNNSGKIESSENDNADENTENKDTASPTETPENPKFFNPITGLETADNTEAKRHGAFIFNSSSPLYGISSADMLMEIPVENGETRYLAMINNSENLGKIGAISPSRDYISNLAGYFNSYTVSYGNDGIYNSQSSAVGLDLSIFMGYHYTEYGSLIYSNGNLIASALSSAGISTVYDQSESFPFNFTAINNEFITGDRVCTSIKLPYSNDNLTELRFSSSDSKYTLIKGENAKHDMLNNEVLSFDNCFILFADTITHDTKDGIDLYMDTSSGGQGYYISKGTLKNIGWSVDESGELIFLDENANDLLINRGKTYIGYLKASLYDTIEYN